MKTTMNYFLVIAFVLCSSFATIAQDLLWANSLGSAGSDIGTHNVIDNMGNIYSAGNFNGTVDFDPGPGTTNLVGNTTGSSSIFVSKNAADGSLVWAKKLTTSSDWLIVQGMSTDDSGNIYLSGQYRGTVDFDPSSGNTSLTFHNYIAFVAKYDNNFNLQWARDLKSGGGSAANGGVAVDGLGNVYLSGFFRETLTGIGLVNLGTFTGDGYVIKYNPSGTLLWARGYHSQGDAFPTAMVVDANDQIVVAGQFNNTMDGDPGAANLPINTAGGYDIFYSKLTSNGDLVYTKKIGGSGGDGARSITTDGTSLYITGNFVGTVDFDANSGVANQTAIGSTDAFLLKLTANGAYNWATQSAGSAGEQFFKAQPDANGNLVVAGAFENDIDLDPGTGTNIKTTNGGWDMFAQRLDSNGNFIDGFSIGSTGNDFIRDVVTDQNTGNFTLIGYLAGTMDANPGTATTTLNSAGGNDIFMGQYGQAAASNNPPVAACQNITLFVGANCDASITASDVDGGSSDPDGDALTFAVDNSGPFAVGTHTIALTVGDGEYTDVCTSILTVVDTIAPIAMARDIVLPLDTNGLATITAADIDTASTDNCGIAFVSITQNSFDCNDLGINTVTLSVTDVNGNSSIATSTVTVIDGENPTIIAPTPPGARVGVVSVTTSFRNAFATSMTNGGNTVVFNQSTAPTAAQLVNLDFLVMTRTPINNDIKNWVANGGFLVTEWISSSVIQMGLVSAVEGGSQNQGPAFAHRFTNTSLANQMSTGLTGPALAGSGFYRPYTATGSTEIHAYRGNTNNQMIIGSSFGSGYAMIFGSTLADFGGNYLGSQMEQVFYNLIGTVGSNSDNIAYLDASGNVSLNPADYHGGVSDNCGVAAVSISPNTANCTNTASPINTVITATDASGNRSTLNVDVTILDTIAPTPICQNITLYLDANGQVDLPVSTGPTSSSVVFNHTFDGTSIDNTLFTTGDFSAFSQNDELVRSSSTNHPSLRTINQAFQRVTGTEFTFKFNFTSFSGSSIGWIDPTIGNIVNGLQWQRARGNLLFITDSGVRTSVQALVPGGFSQNVWYEGRIVLQAGGADYYIRQVGANTWTSLGSTNNNTSTNLEIGVGNDAQALGDRFDDWKVTSAAAVAQGIDNGSSDNCGIASITFDQTTFSCADLGTKTVIMTLTDHSNNVSTCNAIVTVLDTISPSLSTNAITLNLVDRNTHVLSPTQIDQLGANAFDNCSVDLTISGHGFDCNSVGQTFNLTLYGTDASGNVDSAQVTVNVTDTNSVCNDPPVAVCRNITIYTGTNCDASIIATDVDGGSSDPDGDALTYTVNNSGPFGIGAHTITLSIGDGEYTDSCTAIVTVVDTTAPIALTQDITVQLDASGNASITAADINNGSNDACGVSLVIDNSNFTCANVGANTVTLTVTDNNGNSSNATANVTVVDNVAPVAIAQDITVQLDASGNASITAADINNGSNDACGIANLVIDNSSFTCTNVGANTITLTVIDNNGNSSNATANVTAIDNVAPVAIAQNITVQLDANGNASITAADIDNGSNDACGVSLVIDNSNFTCANVGANTVTLTVTDHNGNIATDSAVVTVVDTVAPTMVCATITVTLDSTGMAVITAADVDAASFDACGISSLTIDKNSFTCADVGNNSVTLTATDLNGNVASCTATVYVEDPTLELVLKNCTSDIRKSCEWASDPVYFKTPSASTISELCGVSCSISDTNVYSSLIAPSNQIPGYVYLGRFNDKKYYCSYARMKWVHAEVDAQQYGGHLAAINNAAENNFLKQAMPNWAKAWIGYSDQVTEGSFVWSNGDSSTYTNWSGWNEPNNFGLGGYWWCGGADYTVFYGNGKWYDRGYYARHEYIMEVPCNNSSVSVTQIAGLPSGSVFPEGVTTITFVALDSASGYTDTCSFNVTIEGDINAPSVSCKAKTIVLSNGAYTLSPWDVDNGSYDDCSGIASLQLIPNTFDSTMVGTNPVTLIATDSAGNVDSCHTIVTIVDPNALSYCGATGNSQFEWIDDVKIKNTTHWTGNDGGYGDYRTVNFNVNKGRVNIRLTPGYSGRAYKEYWRIWIDYNNDGDFDDQGERVFQRRKKHTLFSRFYIPNHIASGTYTMRIGMSYGGYPSPCGYCGYGEYEDYKISISNHNARMNGINDTELIAEQLDEELDNRAVSLFPNPTKGELNLEFTGDFNSMIEIEVRSISGKLIQKKIMNGETLQNRLSLDMSSQTNGVYFIRVREKDYIKVIKFTKM